TLAGISTWHEFTWPETDKNANYLYPAPTTYSQPTKVWTAHISIQEEKQSEKKEDLFHIHLNLNLGE
ncbi:1618_t:CDS:2, partial [Gigaspora margarita]